MLLTLFALCVGIAAFDLVFPPPLHHADGVSPLVTDRNGEWLHGFATKEGRLIAPSLFCRFRGM